MNLRTSIAIVMLAALPSMVACATEPKSPSVGLVGSVNPPTLPGPGPGPGTQTLETTYNIYLGDSIRVVCAGPDPFFAFDISKPSLDAQPTMKTLVTCMSTGPLSGKRIKLIGHTDPRGTASYNQRLGLDRATKVENFLVANGIDSSRVDVTSAGADDASPLPRDWPQDRRVEIVAAP